MTCASGISKDGVANDMYDVIGMFSIDFQFSRVLFSESILLIEFYGSTLEFFMGPTREVATQDVATTIKYLKDTLDSVSYFIFLYSDRD